MTAARIPEIPDCDITIAWGTTIVLDVNVIQMAQDSAIASES